MGCPGLDGAAWQSKLGMYPYVSKIHPARATSVTWRLEGHVAIDVEQCKAVDQEDFLIQIKASQGKNIRYGLC